jgi:hypothetical protein
MSKSLHRSPPPSPPPSGDADDERTAVRMRPGRAPRGHSSGEHQVVRPDEREDSDRPTVPSPTRELVERSEGLVRKLRFARVLLKLLPASDSRARVLRAAVMRRDEVLLDGMLRVLDAVNDLDDAGALQPTPEASTAGEAVQTHAVDRPRTLLPPAPDPDSEPEPEEIA